MRETVNNWFYQMRARDATRKLEAWRPGDYRKRVCEKKESVIWSGTDPRSVKKLEKGGPDPSDGDEVVFFFCKTGLRDEEMLGIYGRGKIKTFKNNNNGPTLGIQSHSA